MGGCWQLVFACCLLVQNLSAEDSVKYNSTSAVKDNSTSAVNPDEELEKNVERRVASLREMGQDEIGKFTDIVLHHCNRHGPFVVTSLNDATVTVKKAIGTMVSLRMTLEKTNCTKKEVNHHRNLGYFDPKKEPPKYCGPLDGRDHEQLDCQFDLFKNERSYGEAVVSHDCKPVKVIGKEILVEHTES